MVNHLIDQIKLDLHDQVNLNIHIMEVSGSNQGGSDRETIDKTSILNDYISFHIEITTKYYKNYNITNKITIQFYIVNRPKFHTDIPKYKSFILCNDVYH